jgi:hypothetical protein
MSQRKNLPLIYEMGFKEGAGLGIVHAADVHCHCCSNGKMPCNGISSFIMQFENGGNQQT